LTLIPSRFGVGFWTEYNACWSRKSWNKFRLKCCLCFWLVPVQESKSWKAAHVIAAVIVSGTLLKIKLGDIRLAEGISA